jgi:hypothetical protein
MPRAEVGGDHVTHAQSRSGFELLSPATGQSFASDPPEQRVHLHLVGNDTGVHDLPRMLQLVGEHDHATLQRHAPLQEHSQILRSSSTVKQCSAHSVAQRAYLLDVHDKTGTLEVVHERGKCRRPAAAFIDRRSYRRVHATQSAECDVRLAGRPSIFAPISSRSASSSTRC